MRECCGVHRRRSSEVRSERRVVAKLPDAGIDLRAAVEESLTKAAEDEVREIDLLQDHLHDDIASYVYKRLKRRPMILPVVVEV